MWVVIFGLATAVGACSSDDDEPEGPRVVQLGGPGETGQELSDEEIAELGDTQYTDADVAFVQNMIPHHEQALEMVALIDQRTDNPDLPKLAERMRVSQLAEIDQLETWLTERDEQLMPGMLTDAEMKQLASARGTAFDRLFLQYMIRHHEGAVLMVEDLLASGNGQEPNLFQLAQHIGPDQGIEIARMKLMLNQL